ncbi:hypothetical protein [Okeania sp.]|uniref:hypothetical protein n=1 Tax=Okeania sp. TaxID=3100323 RepID=UPI002B4B5C52|nr:hypothetical protein [Okeania sp.]MEB3340740.1 hypothetical protein [Okeania sp.]
MLTSNTPKTERFQLDNISEITIDKTLDKMEENGIKMVRQLFQNYQNEIHQLQQEVSNLKMVIRDKDEKIQELESLPHPESPNGDGICNWLD